MSEDLQDIDTTEAANAPAPAVPELSQLLVHLLKGVLYRDDDEKLWASLLRLQARVREQAVVLLLDLVLDEAEGYAYLKSRPDPDESDAAPRLPRLIARRPLSYPVSLMLALLRKRLAEFDAGGGDTRLVLSREDIAELMRVFLPDGSNEARLIDQVDATISKVVDLGFLRKLKPAAGSTQDRGHYEVRRILKAFVDAQWLAEFDVRLEVYRTALSAGTSKGESDA
ncbi:DUF4194 domain-containing protein [uncultured Aquimonas sp.]|jgi:hypothetical protein|uniref:DUF4194 domain-containing protein n=1 Tax=uncultured Aquimonas sp. TaxID=385483 RepID=UPI00086AD2E5|nr:DUF4194 domain-containing protein [uncultured Aquimonas sp.]ODU43645.1 MAG: hypothetical protein ABS96_22015 [Xanthomonadaceae bacterium SCN 69-123]